jgi:hypothetical protein
MNCSACGKPNADGVSFCEFCGARLRSGSASNSEPQVARTRPAQPPPPSAAEVAQMGKSILSSLIAWREICRRWDDRATCGLLSCPGFLRRTSALSQVCSASWALSGAQSCQPFRCRCSQVVGAVYFILLAAIAAGVLFYFSRKAATAQKLLIGGFQVMIGSLFGPGVHRGAALRADDSIRSWNGASGCLGWASALSRLAG